MHRPTEKQRGDATAADLLPLPDHSRIEVIDGELVERAAPSGAHGNAQLSLGSRLRVAFDRRPGGRLPGGWWIMTEVEVEFDTHEVYLPDVAGWRRERVPERPRDRPVRLRPDWVCEVLSPSTARNDLVKKLRTLHRCGIPHYWVVDPERETLTVYRWHEDGFLTVSSAMRGERVHAEPFEAIELNVGGLFGEEPDDD